MSEEQQAVAQDKVEGTVVSATGSAEGSTQEPSEGVTVLPPTKEPGETAENKVYEAEGKPTESSVQRPPEGGESSPETPQPTTLPAQAHLRQAQVQVSRLYTFLHNAGNVDAIVEGDLRAIWEDLETHIKEII